MCPGWMNLPHAVIGGSTAARGCVLKNSVLYCVMSVSPVIILLLIYGYSDLKF
jgi:hypothetical protein